MSADNGAPPLNFEITEGFLLASPSTDVINPIGIKNLGRIVNYTCPRYCYRRQKDLKSRIFYPQCTRDAKDLQVPATPLISLSLAFASGIANNAETLSDLYSPNFALSPPLSSVRYNNKISISINFPVLGFTLGQSTRSSIELQKSQISARYGAITSISGILGFSSSTLSIMTSIPCDVIQ